MRCVVGVALAPTFALAQQVFVIPMPRPHEPDVLSVCACDFQDNFWLSLVSGLLRHAPGGFRAHGRD